MRDPKHTLPRRGLLAGAGAVGAAAAVAALVPAAPSAPSSTDAQPALKPEGAAGYRLSEHVKRYYASTRI